MTEQEYNEKIAELKKLFNSEKQIVDKEFAFSNCPYKIGDIVKDHFHIIRIEKLTLSYGIKSEPTIKFIGIELDKKLQPTKKQTDPWAYQANIKEKLN